MKLAGMSLNLAFANSVTSQVSMLACSPKLQGLPVQSLIRTQVTTDISILASRTKKVQQTGCAKSLGHGRLRSHTFFLGVAHDLVVMRMNLEGYVRRIILEISKLALSEPLRTQMTTSIDHGEYQGRPFIRMRVPGQNDLSSYDGAYPVRKNSETVDMGPSEVLAQSKLFRR